MKRTLWLVLALPILAAVLATAGGPGYWWRYASAAFGGGTTSMARLVTPRLRLAGSESGLARATAEAELIAPEALQQATNLARLQRAHALVVHRHGHRVLEYFGSGTAGTHELEGGELSASLFALALGPLVDARRLDPDAAVSAIRQATVQEAGWKNPWSAAARRRFALAAPPAVLQQDMEGDIANTISVRVWQPLEAADAGLWGQNDSKLRLDCCVVARLDDWMRLGDLLLQQGSYQGQRLVSPDWVRWLLNADAKGVRHPVWLKEQRPWQGDEPPATRDIYWFDLGNDARLWLAPQRGLSVLYWGRGSEARDTLVLNVVLRGLLDQLPSGSGATDLNDLVPGHQGM